MTIAETYHAWQAAEVAAAVGTGTLADAREARSTYGNVARRVVDGLQTPCAIAVRGNAPPRVDVAEHVAPRSELIVGKFKRDAGHALCNALLVVGENLVEVKRRAPSCARCLLIAEELGGKISG